MWMICLSRRLERRDVVLEDGGDGILPDLKPIGGLYVCGSGTLTLKTRSKVNSAIIKTYGLVKRGLPLRRLVIFGRILSSVRFVLTF